MKIEALEKGKSYELLGSDGILTVFYGGTSYFDDGYIAHNFLDVLGNNIYHLSDIDVIKHVQVPVINKRNYTYEAYGSNVIRFKREDKE